MVHVIIIQLLNGVQHGILLFLLAAGLTLIFGIMDFVNLAHGSLYMVGAFLAATVYNHTSSFVLAIATGVFGCFVLAIALERAIVSRLYQRGHLDHVLVTFGLLLFFNELARIIWGAGPYYTGTPKWLSGTIQILGIHYPLYRFTIIIGGLAVAIGSYVLIHRTRLGMLIRAGSVNPQMVSVLGVNIELFKALLFGLGAALAGLAGALVGPLVSVQAGMGDSVLITTLVVIITGGIGSIRGAFFAALIVGIIDTMGRIFLPLILKEIATNSVAYSVGPAVASMLIYIVMAVVLAFRPQGLFPPN